MPENHWVFFFVAADASQNAVFSFTSFTNPAQDIIREASKSNWLQSGGQMYPLQQQAFLSVGGDQFAHGCGCSISRFKLFEGLFVSQTDLMSYFADNFPCKKDLPFTFRLILFKIFSENANL